MRMKWAAVCPECDEIFELSQMQLTCPVCGNKNYIRLDSIQENAIKVDYLLRRLYQSLRGQRLLTSSSNHDALVAEVGDYLKGGVPVPEKQGIVSHPEILLTLEEGDYLPTLSEKAGLARININGIEKTFKTTRRFIRVNHALMRIEESGPIGEEPCFDEEWYPCEEVRDEKA